MKMRKPIASVLFLIVILILVLVILYSGLQILESTVLHSRQGTEETFVSKVIERDGVEYFPRQDITTVLVMGIDQFGPVEKSEFYTNTGATDMNILMVFDERDKTCTLINLNRDTMVEMPALGVGGRPAGTYYGQLALSHTYGSGLNDSCENTAKTVSDLFCGISIDYYIAMNMDAIGILNDAVGGVQVNVTEDFSLVDETIGKGLVTLQGEQAIHYVRSRQGVGDQLNTSRIERQKGYLEGFRVAFRNKLEREPEFFSSAYERVEPYITTNCSINAVVGMLERYGDYAVTEIITPEGESVRGEVYYEFYLDAKALDELTLRIFFEPKG